MHICEFQEMMRHIYFKRDSKRGIKGTFNWLIEEIKELEDAFKGNDKKALEDEFADVLAWLASLANVANIDLDEAATFKYNGKCPKCQKIPCKCLFLRTIVNQKT